jgi:membrane protein implicated in regulation of membrane protease activity
LYKETYILPIFSLLPGFLMLMAIAPLASAYIGPGSGISVIGSLLGLLVTILLAFAAILLWPFRRMLKRRRLQADATDDDDTQGDTAGGVDTTTAETDAVEGKNAT